MSHHDEHDRWRGVVQSAAPEALPRHELDGMLAHADQCPACAPSLRDFAARALVVQAPLATLDAGRSADIRARILDRAAHRGTPAVPERRSHRPGYASAFTGTGGWMAAAALVVALLTHHAFHEPLDTGWLAASFLALVALGLGVYAVTQRRRLAELERRLETDADARPR